MSLTEILLARIDRFRRGEGGASAPPLSTRLVAALPWIEIAVCYGFLALYLHRRLDPALATVIYTSVGIVFALFYQYRGILAGCLFLVLAILRNHGWSVTALAADDYFTLVISLGIIYSVGQVRHTLQQTIDILNRKADLLETRTSNVLTELISFEVSHRVFLEDMYFRLDDPVYLYHELRRQSLAAEDETEFNAQVFKTLNRYLFVEKGGVYRRRAGGYDLTFRYGSVSLPEAIESSEEPAYFELMRQSRKVVFSRFPDRHGFLIAIPVFGALAEEPTLVYVIERIRFVMLNARSAQSLKAMSLLLRGTFERKFMREELQRVSATKGAIVLDRENTRKALMPRLQFLDDAKIPWRALAITPDGAADLDPLAAKMELCLRVLDEMYHLGGDILVLLVYIDNTAPVLSRMQANGIPTEKTKELDRADIQARLDRAL